MNTVDTTGAGDAFVGALLVHMAEDANIIHVLFTFPFLLGFLFIMFSTLYDLLTS